MKMKLGLVGLAALLLTAFAPREQGYPLVGRDIILEGDPISLTMSGTTDRSGGVLLSAQPGRYALKLPNVQTLRVPAVARIEVGRAVLTPHTIQPGGRGDAYFMGRDGRRLTGMVPRGARVRVVLTEGAPVGGGGSAGGSTRIGIPGPPIVTEDGDIINGSVDLLRTNGAQGDTGTNPEGRAGARVATGDVNGDGRADARTGPRRDSHIPPPAVAAPRTVTVVGTVSQER